jgi:hypothetical protein
VREGQLVRAGVPGLVPVWHNADWRVYQLLGASGIVSGPGRLLSEHGATVVLEATRPGRLLVRVRFTTAWHVRSGAASLREGADGWIALDDRRAGKIVLTISL